MEKKDWMSVIAYAIAMCLSGSAANCLFGHYAGTLVVAIFIGYVIYKLMKVEVDE